MTLFGGSRCTKRKGTKRRGTRKMRGGNLTPLGSSPFESRGQAGGSNRRSRRQSRKGGSPLVSLGLLGALLAAPLKHRSSNKRRGSKRRGSKRRGSRR